MNNYKAPILAVAIAFLMSGCSVGLTKEPDVTVSNKKMDYVGGYYFGYHVNGVKGMQVFDDHSTTYLQIPGDVVVEKVWTYQNDYRHEELFDFKDHSIRVPKVSMKIVVLTNKGLFIAERKENISYQESNKVLHNALIMQQINHLLNELKSIKSRIAQRMEKING